MYCINCGDLIEVGEKFCTKCGKEVIDYDRLSRKGGNKSLIWRTILATLLIASAFWFVYYYGFVSKDSESANVMVHLIETVGRQDQAWKKSEQITELITAGLSDECLSKEGCVDEVMDMITVLRAEVDKERLEIEKLWSENVIGQDFDSFFYSLDDSSKNKLIDVMNIYFPTESEELKVGNQLL